MNRTPIEWVKKPDGAQGYTWNPITGCLNGCPYCYARKLANGRLKQRYLANENIADNEKMTYPRHIECMADPFYPREWFSRRERALEGKKPKGVFVCDMSDLFGVGIPDTWTECVLETIKVCPEHRFYLLTKQPQNLIKFSPFPDNCWVGVTATDDHFFTHASEYMAKIEAKVKYVSFEPLLGSIEAVRWGEGLFSLYQWLIIGACTGSWRDIVAMSAKYPALTAVPYGNKWTLQPKIEWVEEIVAAADKAGIKVFLKDNLRPLTGHLILENTRCLSYPYGDLRQEVVQC